MSMRSEVYDVITKQITAQLGKAAADLSEDTKFEEDLGFKSVNYVLLSSALEDEFEVEVPYIDLKRSGTIGRAVDFMVEQLSN